MYEVYVKNDRGKKLASQSTSHRQETCAHMHISFTLWVYYSVGNYLVGKCCVDLGQLTYSDPETSGWVQTYKVRNNYSCVHVIIR